MRGKIKTKTGGSSEEKPKYLLFLLNECLKLNIRLNISLDWES